MNKKIFSLIGVIVLMTLIISCAKKDSDSKTSSNSNDNSSTANELFVSVGENGTIITSSNGISWDPRTSGISNGLYSVVYKSGIYLIGGLLTSNNGISWQSSTLQDTGIWGASYENGLFVLVGSNGKILTSIDGYSWNLRTSGTSNDLIGIT